MLRSALAVLGLAIGLSSSAQCITSYPHNQPFTSGTVGTPGTLPTNWTNLTGDDINWNVDNNGTNGSSLIATGPYTDHTFNNTTANGKYMYVESAGAGNTPSKTAILESPCFNLVGVSAPYLTFWYHMRGTNMGSLVVDVNANGTVTQNVWTVSGNQGLYWKQGWLNLAPYNAQTNLRIRFRAITGTGELSDIAIDDVFLGSLSPVFGCNEPTAANYNAGVNLNNGSCSYSCPAGQSRIRIDIFHDSYQGETSWTLKNGAGTTLATGTTSTSLCVPSGTCLVFRINDTAGDGIWHNSYGYGQYYVWQDGALIRQGGQFGSFEETTFNCPPGFNCGTALPISLASITGVYPQTLATFTTTAVEQWYDFTPPQTGQYQISTCALNTCDTRLWLYDFPCSSIVLSDGVEGATFADDNDGGCGARAVVNANMPGGTVHHLRVGHNTATSGCGNAITVRIIYNGPAVGCMNTASCNYDPLATVPCGSCCLPVGDPNCPEGPDLVMDQPRLQSTLTLQQVNITDNCAPAEGCVRALGQRYVLRFATRINNIGSMDYYIGSPSSQPQMFNSNNCHGHSHYAGYADYLLFDQAGNAIPAGFKNGYCVIDVGCTPGHTGQFGCSNMGITAGCFDEYGTGTTCNWIDITDVPNGTYTLVLRTNWQQAPDALGRHEVDYTNNFAQVCINITRNAQNVPSFTVVTTCPTWTDCMGQAYGDARLDCNGVCNGPTKRGDLNNDGNQTQPDALEYVTRILGNDISPTNCNDLNDDDLITVTDAGLMVDTYTQNAAHASTGHMLHYHPWLDFPRGFQTTDQVDLMLANLDPINKTVDVLMRNPTARVLGYEFTVSGITIQSAQNLSPNLEGTPDEIVLGTSLGGIRVIGLSYLDSTVMKYADFAPLCRIHYLALTAGTICITDIVDIVNKDGNNVLTSVSGGCLTVPNTVVLRPKAWLEGPYAATLPPLMRDDLRVAGFIPGIEPYTGLGFTHASGGGGEQTNAGVLAVTGVNAIVDWVFIEARSTIAPHAVLATRSGLLQRDGDIVGVDGTSPVLINLAAGSYHIAVRHRNHFGVMTASSFALSSTPTDIDFRDAALTTWGTEARKSDQGTMLLWAGNAIPNAELKYVGQGNDRDPILSVVGGAVPTGTMTGYYLEDTNMSGVVKYTGSDNDRDLILVNIGGSVPTNTRVQQLP